MNARSLIIALMLATVAVPGCPSGSGTTDGDGNTDGNGAAAGGVPDVAGNFFVNNATGSDGNTGQQDAPLASIQAGIVAASQAGGGSVYVAGGVYAESISLRSNVSLFGSYNPSNWELDVNGFPTTLSGGTTAVAGDNVTSVIIATFRIAGANATTPTTSSVAVGLSLSTNITIRNNSITAGNGADGEDGTDGAAIPQAAGGSSGADAGICTPPRGGGPGGPGNLGTDGGTGGTGGLAGGFDGAVGTALTDPVIAGGTKGTGSPTGQDGAAGGPGNPGLDGTSGTGGLAFGGLIDGFYAPSGGTSAPEDFSPGTGGGGGGGGGGAIVFACGAGGGGGGAGGDPGERGGVGTGGGASIGILLNNSSSATITDNLIETRTGGDGGRGGAGSDGGAGGTGGAGGARQGAQGAGGKGGNGGKGGDAGDSGGGGGGPSIGIVENTTSSTTRSGNTFAIGDPGKGGAAPAGASPTVAGADGEQAQYKKMQ